MPTEKGRDIDRSTFIPFSASRTTRRSLGRYVARCCTTIQMLNYDNRRTDDVATQIDSNTHHLQHGSERPWLSQGLASTGRGDEADGHEPCLGFFCGRGERAAVMRARRAGRAHVVCKG